MSKTLRSARHKRLTMVVAQARHDRKLTQAELAERLGRPQSFVAKTESGERRLDVIELIDLADALGIDVADVVAKVRGDD